MPAYPIPPWLYPESPVQPYLQGANLGARVAGEQATRMLQQQQMAEEASRYTQDYALRKAQAEAEMSIRQQTAQEQAARQAMQFQAANQIEEDIRRGTSAPEAYARNLAKLTVGGNLGGGAGIISGMRPIQPPRFGSVNIGGQTLPFASNPNTGSVSWGRLPTGVSQVNKPTPQQAEELKYLYGNLKIAKREYMKAFQEVPTPEMRGGNFNLNNALDTLRSAQKAVRNFWQANPRLTQQPVFNPAEANKSPEQIIQEGEEGVDATDHQTPTTPSNMQPDQDLIFEDGETTWRYIGPNADPMQDRDPNNWEEVQRPPR